MITQETERAQEWLKCSQSFLYFVDTYVQIYNATVRAWVPFKLWPFQARVLKQVHEHKKTIILKARQLGQTWLMLAFALWLILFRPAAAIGIFSRREEEAIDLLDTRLKGMYQRLPEWLRSRQAVADNKKYWALANESWARAFPTNAGDSYTFTLGLVDEADLTPDLEKLLGGVQPTVDAGGWLILLSRVDKGAPESPFKQIYRAARLGLNNWHPIFLPWNAHPDRNEAWYEAQKQDSLSRTGALDYVHEQYPATDTEALAPRSLDKRITPDWIEACYQEMKPLNAVEARGLKAEPDDPDDNNVLTNWLVQAPTVPGLEIYRWPEEGKAYVMGADPAEGNPTSDDSAATILEAVSGEEVAVSAGKFQPKVFAAYLDAMGAFYNRAAVLVERNNHGHTVIGWLQDFSTLPVLKGVDEKPGWLSNSLGKAILYDGCAETFRDRQTKLHSFATYVQLASIEGTSLRAPSGLHDDRADSYALANLGRAKAIEERRRAEQAAMTIPAQIVLAESIFG